MRKSRELFALALSSGGNWWGGELYPQVCVRGVIAEPAGLLVTLPDCCTRPSYATSSTSPSRETIRHLCSNRRVTTDS